MTRPPNSSFAAAAWSRRRLLRYAAGGSLGAIAVGLLRPRTVASAEPKLELLCSMFPQNSRCTDYLPGSQAIDETGEPIAVDALLPTATPGQPVPVRGLPDNQTTYLVIQTGPTIASYGIRPICTHWGCTVDWQADQNRFVCPCHDSQFDSEGRVLAGPAEEPLPLATVVVRQNRIGLVDRAPSVEPRQGL
ncbi:Rieske 2Fe-2S domain-containing protein [Leptolyngbya sp. KIOST-1]|uniref:Rieske 2Fe-2S domain-containing protein n=1 Tax=Leptolyngbya sp. KIOST-1 TaxID=1229172 RepID=UPI00056CBE4A|nr:Rieske 2Fe-2S domain-containing protein [Leptolyngbya sp. KIOST-1]